MGRKEKVEKVEIETFYRTIQVKLTDEEIMIKGQALARSESERYKLLGEIKAYADARKPLIKEKEASIAELTSHIETGKEPREVNCYWKYNFPQDGYKTLMTFEKNEEVGEYPMEEEEQTDLFINGAPEKAGSKLDNVFTEEKQNEMREMQEALDTGEVGVDVPEIETPTEPICIGNCKISTEECNSRQKPAEEPNEFPNAGKKWSREDEEKLEFLFKAGKTLEDLSEIFGRPVKGIKARLTKLNLIEE